MTNLATLFSTALLLTTAACGKKDAPAGAPAGTAAKAGAAAKAPAPLARIAVPELGITIEMPGDAKPDITVGPAGTYGTVSGDSAPGCVVMLDKVDPEAPGSFDKTLAKINEGKAGGGALKALAKQENGSDGSWKFEWTAADGFGVDYRAIVGGTGINCGRVTNTAEDQACVAKACASLQKS
jgi:hypothetical protein